MANKFEVRDAQIEKDLRDIGQAIGKSLPEGYGFNLLIFNFGEGGATFYISNAQRDDMIKAMKEFIAKQEAENGKH